MSNHDHSKVEVGPTGNITAAVSANGNGLTIAELCAAPHTSELCPAYGRYIDRRVSHPAEDPRASARWANDWPASREPISDGGCLLDAGGARLYTTAGTVPPPPRLCPNTAAEDEYPPVYARPTFFLYVLIAAWAGMMVGLIVGAMVMA